MWITGRIFAVFPSCELRRWGNNSEPPGSALRDVAAPGLYLANGSPKVQSGHADLKWTTKSRLSPKARQSSPHISKWVSLGNPAKIATFYEYTVLGIPDITTLKRFRRGIARSRFRELLNDAAFVKRQKSKKVKINETCRTH